MRVVPCLLALACSSACEAGSRALPRDGGGADGGAPLDGGPSDAASEPIPADAMPPPGAFCALPGSVVFTAQGSLVVPGGAGGTPSLGWLHLPAGFCAHYFAHVPVTRQLRFAPDGHLFAASPRTATTGGASNGAASIVALPDDDHDGLADQVATYLGNLPSTQGLLFTGGYFYFQDGATIRRVPFKSGDLSPSAAIEAVSTITAQQAPEHWPKLIDVARDGTLYVTNGSTQGEACVSSRPFFGGIFRIDGTGTAQPVAKGFRNPIALRCEANHDVCLAAELSLDYSGPEGGREKIVPVRQGDDWGFPCCATQNLPYGNAKYQDTGGVPNCSGVAAESSSFLIGHTPFGIAFEGGKWPAPFAGRALVTLHGVFGSWEGARVVGIALDPATGLPLPASEFDAGPTSSSNMLDFATGWDDGTLRHGRPAAVEFAPDGRLFLGDDQLGTILWIAPLDLKP